MSRKKFSKEEVVKLLLESYESDVEPSSESSDFIDPSNDAAIVMKVLQGRRIGRRLSDAAPVSEDMTMHPSITVD